MPGCSLGDNGELSVVGTERLNLIYFCIEQAKILAAEQNMDIDFYACPAEDIDYPDNTFDVIKQEEFRVDVPFSREGWHGRMRACRGVGASMNEEELAKWNEEHWKMLLENAQEEFFVKHYISVAELQVKK